MRVKVPKKVPFFFFFNGSFQISFAAAANVNNLLWMLVGKDDFVLSFDLIKKMSLLLESKDLMEYSFFFWLDGVGVLFCKRWSLRNVNSTDG